MPTRTPPEAGNRQRSGFEPVYLDCNASTPLEQDVFDAMTRYFLRDYGNTASEAHHHGKRAKQAVNAARGTVAKLVGARSEDVIFTSGATEANNLAILGLEEHAATTNRRHLISTEIEHKAVLKPLARLAERGFQVDLLKPTAGGWVEPDTLKAALRPDTALVSIMHINNETGVAQPIREMAEVLGDHPAFLHVDAAQGFGKDLTPLRHERIDLISASAHKVYGPKGIGALILRRRNGMNVPLAPILQGGGQERGLRSGTLPVPLIVGFGKAAEMAERDAEKRQAACRRFRERALAALAPLRPVIHGDPERILPHVMCLSFEGVSLPELASELAVVTSVSRGAACTEGTSEAFSHVLMAMRVDGDLLSGAIRMSWCHLTPDPDWERFGNIVRRRRPRMHGCFACRVGY